MNINFRDITSGNFDDCISLKVKDDQKSFVKPNYYTLTQAYYEPFWILKGIYNNDTIIGLALYGIFDNDDNTAKEGWICRYMIDKEFQGNGYGKEGLIKIIDLLENTFNCEQIGLSEVPENHIAKKLYESLNFTSTGEFLNDQEIMVRKTPITA